MEKLLMFYESLLKEGDIEQIVGAQEPLPGKETMVGGLEKAVMGSLKQAHGLKLSDFIDDKFVDELDNPSKTIQHEPR